MAPHSVGASPSPSGVNFADATRHGSTTASVLSAASSVSPALHTKPDMKRRRSQLYDARACMCGAMKPHLWPLSEPDMTSPRGCGRTYTFSPKFHILSPCHKAIPGQSIGVSHRPLLAFPASGWPHEITGELRKQPQKVMQ